MKKKLIQILSAVLLSLLCACHAEISERNCALAVCTVGEQRNPADYSYDSALEYQYRMQLAGTAASESEWVHFTYPQMEIPNLRIGTYELYIRAVKDGKVYSSGNKQISVTGKGPNDFTIVLSKTDNVSAKGTLRIKEKAVCSNLNVEITYDGPQYEKYSGNGSSEYSQELDNGFYVVSIVYKNGNTVVGGRSFSVYVEAYSTGTVSIETGINQIKRNVEIKFYNLSAPHKTGKVCTGYTLNGVNVEFPHTFEVTGDGIPTYSELGLNPVYAPLTDKDTILASDHIEVWSEDLPSTGYFLGSSYMSSETPKMIVVNGNPKEASFAMLRDLETAVVKNATLLLPNSFYSNKKLKNVYLCASITACENGSFASCDSLSDFYLEAPDRNGIKFDNKIDLSKYNFHYNCKF